MNWASIDMPLGLPRIKVFSYLLYLQPYSYKITVLQLSRVQSFESTQYEPVSLSYVLGNAATTAHQENTQLLLILKSQTLVLLRSVNLHM
jgi:hypothetical protein